MRRNPIMIATYLIVVSFINNKNTLVFFAVYSKRLGRVTIYKKLTENMDFLYNRISLIIIEAVLMIYMTPYFSLHLPDK